jgi:hypothetical protein
MKIFVPEKYVYSREILVDVPGEGLGILVTQERFRKLLSEKQIDARVISQNLMKVVHEH